MESQQIYYEVAFKLLHTGNKKLGPIKYVDANKGNKGGGGLYYVCCGH